MTQNDVPPDPGSRLKSRQTGMLSKLLLCVCLALSAGAEQLKNLAAADSGAVFIAEPTAVNNGSLAYINDGYDSSYWYAGDNQPKSSVLVLLREPGMVHGVRFLSWATGRHAPRDYEVIALDSRSGESHLLAGVKGDTTLGPKWVEIKAGKPVLADQGPAPGDRCAGAPTRRRAL